MENADYQVYSYRWVVQLALIGMMVVGLLLNTRLKEPETLLTA